MAKRDFDFKQFMLQKGDKVGIGVAAGLAVLLLLCGVFMLFGKDASLSPNANAENLDKVTKEKEQKFVTNAPTDAKRQELIAISDEIKYVKDLNKPVPLNDYFLGVPFSVGTPTDDKTLRSPVVFSPAEFLVKVIHLQMGFHMFDNERKAAVVLVDPPKSKKDGDSKNPRGGGSNNFYQSKAGSMGMGSQGPPGGSKGGMFPGGMGAMGGPGGMMGSGPTASKPDPKTGIMKPFEKLSSGDVLAENLYPIRAAEIVGSFPLKKQLEEFKSAMHARSIGELYDPAHGPFGFRGVKVQRRTLAADGTTVVEGEDWADLDLTAAVRWWALNNGRRFEDEDPKLLPLLQWSDGLVMARPQQIEDASEKYPALETELPTIKKSLEDLNKLDKKAAPPKNPFTGGEDISPFNRGGMDATEGTPDTKIKTGSGGGNDAPDKEGAGGQQMEAPEYALIRFLDVTIKPGKTYEYQVKVLVNNPNYKREGLPEYLTEKKELESVEWTPVGHKLFVPEEIQYYAYDAKKHEKKFSGATNNPGSNQAVLQIHRWVDYVTPKAGAPGLQVGDWLIAERVLVYRGENIGQVHQVKVPNWMYNQSTFVLATNSSGPARDKHYIDVPFSGVNNDAVLVDFTLGTVSYKKNPQAKDDGTETPAVEIKQEAPAELLILTPEGKLILRDYDTDKADEERKKCVEHWKERIEKIEKGDKPGGKPGDDLFNKGGGAGGGA